MTERQANILITLVREFIRTGEPVGSSVLAAKARPPVSSATIRNDLKNLEELGLIEQPHTSAGRIPTDKGYRYFVDQLSAYTRRKANYWNSVASQFEALQAGQHNPRTVARLLANISDAIAVSSNPSKQEIEEAGFPEWVTNLRDENDLKTSSEIGHFISNIETYIDQLIDAGNGQTRVFIGHENPVMPAQRTSVLVRTVRNSEGDPVTMILVGPKRMPYQRNIALLDEVAKFFNS